MLRFQKSLDTNTDNGLFTKNNKKETTGRQDKH